MKRVPGHTLRLEGAPHDETGRRISCGWHGGVSGEGRALCSCGEMSDVLSSATRRQLWHKDHKQDVLLREYAEDRPDLPWNQSFRPDSGDA